MSRALHIRRRGEDPQDFPSTPCPNVVTSPPSISIGRIKSGRHVEARTWSVLSSSDLKTLTLPVRTLVAHRNNFTEGVWRSRSKSTNLFKNGSERIEVERIIEIRRREIAQRIHEQITGRMIEPKLPVYSVNQRWLHQAVGSSRGHSLPEQVQRIARSLAPANRQAMSEYDGIDGAGARRRYTLKE